VDEAWGAVRKGWPTKEQKRIVEVMLVNLEMGPEANRSRWEAVRSGAHTSEQKEARSRNPAHMLD
jgi:hypothetical protein